MTTPGQNAPDGAWQFGDRMGQEMAGMTREDIIAMMTGQARSDMNTAVGGWNGMTADVDDLAEQVHDVQLELGERVDLLDGVRGYCSTYLGSNWLVPGNQGKQLPFDAQLGPAKGAAPQSGGIRLLEKGLWRADAHVGFQVQSGWFTGAARAVVYLTVRVAATWETYSQREYSLVVGRAGDETAAFSHTFVVPEDDTYIVTVDMFHQNTRQYVFGGTLRSALSVNKWDFRVTNAVVAPTVPDGGTL